MIPQHTHGAPACRRVRVTDVPTTGRSLTTHAHTHTHTHLAPLQLSSTRTHLFQHVCTIDPARAAQAVGVQAAHVMRPAPPCVCMCACLRVRACVCVHARIHARMHVSRQVRRPARKGAVRWHWALNSTPMPSVSDGPQPQTLHTRTHSPPSLPPSLLTPSPMRAQRCCNWRLN